MHFDDQDEKLYIKKFLAAGIEKDHSVTDMRDLLINSGHDKNLVMEAVSELGYGDDIVNVMGPEPYQQYKHKNETGGVILLLTIFFIIVGSTVVVAQLKPNTGFNFDFQSTIGQAGSFITGNQQVYSYCVERGNPKVCCIVSAKHFDAFDFNKRTKQDMDLVWAKVLAECPDEECNTCVVSVMQNYRADTQVKTVLEQIGEDMRDIVP